MSKRRANCSKPASLRAPRTGRFPCRAIPTSPGARRSWRRCTGSSVSVRRSRSPSRWLCMTWVASARPRSLWSTQGRYAQADLLYQRVLCIREQQLGRDHPGVGQTLYDLALLRQKQGKLNEAFSLAQRALTIRSQVLGDAHPKTIATRTLLAQLVQDQEDGAESPLEQLRTLLRARGWSLHLKRRRGKPMSTRPEKWACIRRVAIWPRSATRQPAWLLLRHCPASGSENSHRLPNGDGLGNQAEPIPRSFWITRLRNQGSL